MIRLHQFSPAFALPNASPFCMKLENYLRMAEVPFEYVRRAKLLKAPKGKMPYIEDGDVILGDSALIIEYLKKTYGDKLDSWLTPEQSAVALAFQRLIEEDLYWAVLYTRWFEPEGWEKTREVFFGKLAPPAKWFLPALARRGLNKELHGHGMGRHSREEIHAIGKRDITALGDFLADKPYFMGDRPCSLDATAYAFVANIVLPPVESTLKQHARQYPQLEAYCERMRSRYYG
jgi:glutathione S-transferase